MTTALTKPRTVPPPPPGFAEEFVRGGWRRAERLYNCRTDLLVKWIDMCGGEELHRQRREFYRCGAVTMPVGGG